METIIGSSSFDDSKGRTRLKCGEVFLWSYGGDACAVECTLCEERPFCSLTTYMEHLQIWHTDWLTDMQISETDGISESDDKEVVEECAPFEEVLIEIEDEYPMNLVNILSEESIHTSENNCESYCTDEEEFETGIEDSFEGEFTEYNEMEENEEIITNQDSWIDEFKRSIYKKHNSTKYEEILAYSDHDDHENIVQNACSSIESEINYDKAKGTTKEIEKAKAKEKEKEKAKSENHYLKKKEVSSLVEAERLHEACCETINSMLQPTTDSGVAINNKPTEQTALTAQTNTLNEANYFLFQSSFSQYDLIKDNVNSLPLTASDKVLLNLKPNEVEQLNAINEQRYKCPNNTVLIQQDNAHSIIKTAENSDVAINTAPNELQSNHSTDEEHAIQMHTTNEFLNEISSSITLSADGGVLYNLKPIQYCTLPQYNSTEVDIIAAIANSTPLSEDSGVALNFNCSILEEISNFLENDCDLTSDITQTTRSEDSGLEKSDTCSLTASTSHTASEDESHFEPHSFNIKEQIRFGLGEAPPKPKLTSANMEQLIGLYKAHPRLWQQNHAEYNEPQLCRESWEEITQAWNELCQLDFNLNDVRIRVSTLCQRYLKERQRRDGECEGEQSKKSTKKKTTRFNYFEQLQFLDLALKSPYKKRTAHISQEHSKLLETYAKFPILWHTDCQYHGRSKHRQRAYTDMSAALRMLDIHLSPASVRRRVTLLKKRYRIEKIRHLKCRLDKKTFEKHFKHYDEMNFLDNHIAPFVCMKCGKIFQKLGEYDNHKNSGDYCGNIDVVMSEDYEVPQLTANNFGNEFKLNEPNEILNQSIVIQPTNYLKEYNANPMPFSESKVNIESFTKLALQKLEARIESDILNEAIDKPIIIEAKSKTIIESDEYKLNNNNTITEFNKKVHCVDKTEIIKHTEHLRTSAPSAKADTTTTDATTNKRQRIEEPIPDEHIRSLIALFRKYTVLWDTHLPNFSSRRSKNVSWHALTTEFNSKFRTNYPWTSVQQRIMHYVRYYRRETRRIEARGTCTSWYLYDDLKFLDSTFASSSDLEKRIQHRKDTLKIIEIYREHPQLWDTTHAEYTKRKQRQLSISLMATQLQKLHNIAIEQDKLKQRLLDLRSSFRTTKLAKIAAEKRNETFNGISQFEFYEELQFLEAHIAPFICQICTMSFDRFSDYRVHQRKEHVCSTRRRNPLTANDIDKSTLENICHICGIEFTLRHNLVQHLNRHFAERTLACTVCGKRFFTSTALHEHERIHTKIPAVICAECGQTFVNASKLNQHMKRHRNQRDYSCERCEKAFYTAFELDRHMHRHLNIRNKVCTVCGKTFVMGSSYYTHIKLHNDKKQYSCTICNKEFAQHAGLYKHRKKHHPQI